MALCALHGYTATDIVPELQDISRTERIRRTDALYAVHKDFVLIEIHANAGKGTGFEVFTSVGETGSDPLAEMMIDSMERTLRPFKLRADTSDGDRDKEANFHIIRTVKCRAFLIECAFMDTWEPDCRMMLENPDQFAEAIFNGMINIQKHLS